MRKLHVRHLLTGLITALLISTTVIGCSSQAPTQPNKDEERQALQKQLDGIRKSNIPQADKDRSIADLEARIKALDGASPQGNQ